MHSTDHKYSKFRVKRVIHRCTNGSQFFFFYCASYLQIQLLPTLCTQLQGFMHSSTDLSRSLHTQLEEPPHFPKYKIDKIILKSCAILTSLSYDSLYDFFLYFSSLQYHGPRTMGGSRNNLNLTK